MSKLAVDGGTPVFERPLDYREIWPPLADSTAKRLQDLYYSRRWTAFDDTERDFAQAFADHHGAKYGIFMVNGTVTLQCALAACGIGAGDEVLVTPVTWCSTALAVRHVGALPVFVDIEPDTLCMDPRSVEAAITNKTRAIIPVHAYGSMANMDALMTIARRHGLRVIEDCAHMHGGFWDGKGVGSIGDVGSFSFQNSKTMSSGEGGICLTNDAGLADRIFRMKQIGYGMGELPRNAKQGPPQNLLCYNFRATAFQAAILQDQLESLEKRLESYRAAVAYLEDRLKRSTKIRFQNPGRKATRQGYYGWMMIFDDPQYRHIPIETLRQAILAEGLTLLRVEGPIYGFILFNLSQDSYRIDRPCAVTEMTCDRALWLFHGFLGLGMEQVQRIAEAIEKVVTHLSDVRAS